MSRLTIAKLTLLVMLAFLCSGCEPAATVTPSSDTKALAKLGGEAVGEVTLSKPVSNYDQKQFDADFDKIMAGDATVTAKIAACRQTPQWLPAEFLLIAPVKIADVEQEFGPSGKKARAHSDAAQKEVEFLTYGNLEVGMEGGAVTVVKVNK